MVAWPGTAGLAVTHSVGGTPALVSRHVRPRAVSLPVRRSPHAASTVLAACESELTASGTTASCYGGYGYPWWYGGIYDPYWWWDSGSPSDHDQQYQTGLANEMNEQSLDEQRLRAARRSGCLCEAGASAAARHASTRTHGSGAGHGAGFPRSAQTGSAELRHRRARPCGTSLRSVQQKIPLSDLDLPATTKANDERGVDFRLPGAHEGQ